MKKIPNAVKLLKRHKQVAFITSLIFITILTIPYNFRIRNRNTPTKLGVSFSTKYAEELGLNWKQAFLALTDEIQVKHFRLMSYWDIHEPKEGVYDFSSLDWQMDQAKRHGADVTLAVGQRQPRWPECHVPDWATSLDKQSYRDHLKKYIATVVNRYKNNDVVKSYQIENEASNNIFGQCDNYDPHFLTEEIKLVKSLDPKALIINNVSTQNGLTLRGPVDIVDKIGFSIYHNAHFEAFGKQYGWRYLFPSQWHSYRAGIITGIKDKQVFVHELQAEPWGPDATVNLSTEEQYKTMNPKQLRAILKFTKQTGIKEIYMWGGEWWYWRLTNFNDRVLWQTVQELFQSAS